nr:hypothetical protein [Tanacetum cinerariifolium]
MDERTKNTSYDHISAGTDPHVLANQTKSVSEGLETVLTQLTTEKRASSTAIHGDKEEASIIIKLEDLAKIVSQIKPSFKDLDSLKDDPVIIFDESGKDKPNAKTKDTSVPRSSSLSSLPTELKDLSSNFNELTKEIKGLMTKVHEVDIELPKELKEIPTKLEDFTKTATSLTRADKITEAKKENLNQQPKPTTPPTTTPINPPIITTTTQIQNPLQSQPRSSSQPEGEHIKKDKGKKVMCSEEAEKQSTKSDSDEEVYTLEKEAKAEAAKQERKVRKAELIYLLGPEVVHKYYNYKLQYDRYYDKMLNRRVESRITNYDVLTRKGPITFNVYIEDGTYEVIPNFKVSDLHLGEWRKVMKACPYRTRKGWKTIYD